jgi:Uma2 family endonuclease
MSTIHMPTHDSTLAKPANTTAVEANGRQVPPLESGDHLSRAEFERRYRAHPEIKKAELVEGVVYVSSPVSFQHAEPHARVITWLGVYQSGAPGIRMADNATLLLDLDNEVQPDAMLWLDEMSGGKIHLTEQGYLAGPPELVVEVAASSAASDLYKKRGVYRRNGVQEYLVLLAYEKETIWYGLWEGEYRPFSPDDNGILQSRVFPGLHFHSDHFWAGDLVGLLDTLKQGLATEEHATFVARLRGEG